jgi:hypothetical protein
MSTEWATVGTYHGALTRLDAEVERALREGAELMAREGATPDQLAKGMAQLTVVLERMRQRSLIEIDRAFAAVSPRQ